MSRSCALGLEPLHDARTSLCTRFHSQFFRSSCSSRITQSQRASRSAKGKVVGMSDSKDRAALSPDAAAFLKRLPFKDCNLIVGDTQIRCHRLKLAEASEVLG